MLNTSEENILKLIKPLFLDALWAEFEKVKSNKTRLLDFHKKLRSLTFFDPACGCGNFLVITYRELRLLELAVLRASHSSGQQVLDVQSLISVDVDQFYGIEIEEFPAQIAQVALWLTDHQMNMKVSQEFGSYFARIPLKATPHIVCDNALTLDWAQVLAPQDCCYILGNPPFVGAKFMDDAQRHDARIVFNALDNGGLLDFVAAWYVKAARYMRLAPSPSEGEGGDGGEPLKPATAMPKESTPALALPLHGGGNIRCAFVSTNSITQGEQVGVLWSWMLAQGVKIHFAHRTFSWSNEARSNAAVYCVIIGFGAHDVADKVIYEYEENQGEPLAVKVNNINPYLVDATDVVLPRRSRPICQVPEIGIGNKPIDGGNYLFDTQERDEFILREPKSAEYFYRWIGADELINGYERWCLWLGECSPEKIKGMPEAMKRVQAVRDLRLASKSLPTQKLATTPTRFHVENIPTEKYAVIAKVSSQKRNFVAVGFEESTTLSSDLLFIAPKAKIFHFGILNSTMHNSWIRYTCGRLGNGIRYSKDIVYNNFPWPEVNALQAAKIETAAQAVLDARAVHTNASLADLYDPLTMPANLLKAHQALDKAVDAAYGYKGAATDAARVAFLFERYQQITSLLPSLTNIKTRPKKMPKKSK